MLVIGSSPYFFTLDVFYPSFYHKKKGNEKNMKEIQSLLVMAMLLMSIWNKFHIIKLYVYSALGWAEKRIVFEF